jgi:hypothetical protein
MHKETERAQGELALIYFVKILVAASPFWNRLIGALNILSKFEGCIDDLRGQFSNMLRELLHRFVVAKRALDLVVRGWLDMVLFPVDANATGEWLTGLEQIHSLCEPSDSRLKRNQKNRKF